jgi:hypothetical protein
VKLSSHVVRTQQIAETLYLENKVRGCLRTLCLNIYIYINIHIYVFVRCTLKNNIQIYTHMYLYAVL